MEQQRPHPPVTQDRGALAAACGEIAALIRRRRGLGPSQSHAYWAGRTALVVLLDDTYTSAEWDLRGHGREADVLAGRNAFNETAEPDFKDIVERTTGHEVAAVLSASHLDPDKTAIVFLLQVGSERGRARVDALIEQASEQYEASRAVLAESHQTVKTSAARRAARDA